LNTEYMKVGEFVGDWLDETGHQGHFNVDLVEKFAQDEAEELSQGNAGKEFISVLYVEDYTAELPVNFQREVQAAYNIYPTKPIRRQEISQFTLPIFDGTGCELKIDIECPKCHRSECSCNTPIIEVNTDHLYKISNPQNHTAYWNHFTGYTNLTEYPRDNRCQYHPQFRLMYPKINDFWNIQYNVSECVNLSVDNEISYLIDRPNIVVNFQQGQILLNYFGLRLDNEGKSLIPKDKDVIDSIVKYVEMKLARADWRRTRSREDDRYYQITADEYKKAHGKAVRKMQMLSPNEMSSLWRNIMMKRDFTNQRPDLNRRRHEQYNPNQTSGRIT
jgi:hypothetical protein